MNPGNRSERSDPLNFLYYVAGNLSDSARIAVHEFRSQPVQGTSPRGYSLKRPPALVVKGIFSPVALDTHDSKQVKTGIGSRPGWGLLVGPSLRLQHPRILTHNR